jgi:hypothetical protein
MFLAGIIFLMHFYEKIFTIFFHVYIDNIVQVENNIFKEFLFFLLILALAPQINLGRNKIIY